MQKKIIALAIASALTVPAMAFADTTIYGVLDAGYAQTKGDNGTVTKETDAFGFSTMTSSRLGFMTTEDLGNGTKVMGKIETGLSGNIMSNYTQGKTTGDGTTIDATSLGNREINASVIFSQGTTVKLGYGSTLIRDFSLGYAPDPGGNLVGNILNNNADFGSNRANGLTLTQAMDNFSVSVQLTDHTTKVTGSVDNKSGNGYLVGGQYAAGPFSIGAAYQDQETITGGVAATSDLTHKIGIVAGSWDFGVAKVLAEYGTDKADQSVAASATLPTKADGLSIGAQAPFGDILGFVQLSKGKWNPNTTSTTSSDQDQSGYTIGAKYNLSKASYGYISLGENKIDSNGTAVQNKVDQFAIGMVHVF